MQMKIYVCRTACIYTLLYADKATDAWSSTDILCKVMWIEMERWQQFGKVMWIEMERWQQFGKVMWIEMKRWQQFGKVMWIEMERWQQFGKVMWIEMERWQQFGKVIQYILLIGYIRGNNMWTNNTFNCRWV